MNEGAAAWTKTFGGAAVSAGVAFVVAAVPAWVDMKSTQDVQGQRIVEVVEAIKDMDMRGPRALGEVKSKVDVLEQKIDLLADLVKSQNDLLSGRKRGP